MLMEIDYTSLPGHMIEATKLYIERGILSSDFLRAAFEDRLVQTFVTADDTNLDHIKDWAAFLYNEAPLECRGSEEKVNTWIEEGGLYGLANIAGHSGKG